MIDPRLLEIARLNRDPAIPLQLDAERVQTWDPQLRREPAILVPMDLKALAAPPSGIEVVPTAPTVLDGGLAVRDSAQPADSSDAARDALVEATRPEPFAAPGQRAPGIWLHWAMPDALTSAAPRDADGAAGSVGNPMGMPALPDRYVVVRMQRGVDSVRSWVIEADAARASALSGWTEAAAASARDTTRLDYIAPDQLTALSGGDAAWAACCDAVLNRFAFHDDLSDLDHPGSARLSYLVCGWWSDQQLDPLGQASSVVAMLNELDTRRWSLPDDTRANIEASALAARAAKAYNLPTPELETAVKTVTTVEGEVLMLSADPAKVGVAKPERVVDARTWPTRTLLHGVVHGVRASGGGGDLRPAGDSIEVAIGGHPFGALSAMLADGSAADRRAAERLMLAFTAGLLPAIEQPDGQVAVDEERHSRSFESVPGGTRAVPDRVRDGDPLPKRRPRARPHGRSGLDIAAAGKAGERRSERRTEIAFRAADSVAAIKPSAARRVAKHQAPDASWARPTYRNVDVPLPRLHYAADPAIVIRRAVRSERHGGDGRYEEDGSLKCRSSGDLDPAWNELLEGSQLPVGLRSLRSGAVPIEVDTLLREAVLTDTSRIDELGSWAQRAHGIPKAVASDRLKAELGFRAIAAESERGHAPVLDASKLDVLRGASLYRGVEASPVALGGWRQPWVPLFLDYELEVELREDHDGWSLGELDLEPGAEVPPGELHSVRGRTLLNASSARGLHDRVQAWLEAEDARDDLGEGQVGERDEVLIRAAADAAKGLDVLTGKLDGLRRWQLGLDPVAPLTQRIARSSSTPDAPIASHAPRLFGAGRFRIKALRLVDAFGRVLDVPSSAPAPEVAHTHAVPDAPRDVLLPPRFTQPARLMFRFADASAARTAGAQEARVDQSDPNAPSPLIGFLMPDHVDEALEFFDAAGEPLGQLFHDPSSEAVVWEGAPGRPGPLGAPPTGSHPATPLLAQLAVGLVRADAAARALTAPPNESALSALLRGIDTTVWSSDPFAAVGSGPIAGLLGRPLAVVRTSLWIDVPDDSARYSYAAGGPSAAERRAAWRSLAAHAISVRLGELARTNDGLMAWFVDDDYDRPYLVSPEARLAARAAGPHKGHFQAFGPASSARPELEPIEHPFVDTRSELILHVGQRLDLTLLMLPGLSVHATCGLLPRKRLTLAREWFETALERVSPSFRVGPVLVEGDASGGVRLPKVTGLGARQEFVHKPDPLGWRADPIEAATQTAVLPDLPYGLREGWIRVSSADDSGGEP